MKYRFLQARSLLYDKAMKQLTLLAHSPMINVALGVLLAFIWGVFAYRHIGAFIATGKIAFLIFCFSESLQAIFFLFRSTPKTVSLEVFDWLVAIGGTFAVLFFRPGGVVLWQGGEVMVLLGVLIQITALCSLNRSFAIVPALRNVKRQGLYSIIRHPMYASYLVLFTGYLLFNATWLNFLLYVFALIFLFLRIEQEEKHLSQDAGYRSYKERVRFRLIPFVY
jgi:protein-S-isoprenylcysteine O-methyltransferase Ste14